jgi:hypothetical protein
MFCKVLVPCVTVPKSRLPGMSVTDGTGARPEPFSAADSVEGEALSVMAMAAERWPVVDGVKEMRMVHDLPGCRAVGAWHVSPVMAKSPGFSPVMVTVFKLSV